jgi:CRISPR/Cas system endoribonuclease Cas6 (RAMP superfamily)
MKIELNLPEPDRVARVAAGSVMDLISTQVARWVESALTKTDAAELTQEEVLGLAVAAGCDVRTVITGEASYRLEAVRPIAVNYVDGEWRVYQQERVTAGDD